MHRAILRIVVLPTLAIATGIGIAVLFRRNFAGGVDLANFGSLQLASGINVDIVTTTFDDSHRIAVRVAILPAGRYRSMLIDQPDRGEGHSHLADICEREGALLGINGGYFKDDFSPDGPFVLNHQTRQPLANRSPLSAVVKFDDAGAITIVPSKDYRGPDAAAFQTGPFLIDPGGTIGVRDSPDVPRVRRSVLALTQDGTLLVIMVPDATLYETAEVLSQLGQILKVGQIERAANLDGGPSCSFWARSGSIVPVLETGPVRNYLLFKSGNQH